MSEDPKKQIEQQLWNIANTLRGKMNADKFSYVALLSEITENEYNLNIPRYVNTFVEEEPFDLKAVSVRLKELKLERMQTMTSLHLFVKN